MHEDPLRRVPCHDRAHAPVRPTPTLPCTQRSAGLSPVPPRIAPFAFQADLHVGYRAGVQCFVTKGDLPVRLEWRKDGLDPEGDVGIRALGAHASSLSIETLQPYHAGTYTCLASNAAAVTSHEARLLVNGNH